eukprot:scaffold2256_cov371-Prasinococcus_capsulatus_cf.AAC.5
MEPVHHVIGKPWQQVFPGPHKVRADWSGKLLRSLFLVGLATAALTPPLQRALGTHGILWAELS